MKTSEENIFEIEKQQFKRCFSYSISLADKYRFNRKTMAFHRNHVKLLLKIIFLEVLYGKAITYREQEKIENTVKLREFLMELPPYVKDYFRAKEPTTSDKTRLSYAYDLRVFSVLQETNPSLKEKSLSEISIQDLSLLEPVDFEEFQEYLKAYQSADNKLETNSRTGIARKMSCLRSFYDYLCKRQLLTSNPVRLVDMPKIKEKAIIQLDPDEVANLLDYIENYGKQLSGVKLYHYNKQKYRDIAIVTLLLGTGVRLS